MVAKDEDACGEASLGFKGLDVGIRVWFRMIDACGEASGER